MVNTRHNGQLNGSSDDDIEIPNLEAMVAATIANMLPVINANEVVSRIINDSFSKLKPLSFSSAASPQEAEDWITHVEKFFEVLGCGDEFKARLATFKLEGDALNWWKAHKRAKGGDVYMTTCTWAEFRNNFYKWYFPDSEQQRFEREYNTIHQKENENSGEYMQRFLRLSSFVGPIAGDASRQAQHFKWGLKGWVLDRLLNTEFADVSAVNDAARNIEIFHEGSGYNKRNRDGVTTIGVSQAETMITDVQIRGDRIASLLVGTGMTVRVKVLRFSRSLLRVHSWLPPPPLCPTCGKPHPVPCHRITGACFNCGSTNHKVKYCPKRNPSEPMNTAGPSTTSGRVFTTTRDQAASTSGTITGI
ncbi:reverse transcriptase domain-containing protein [Artemisia annua]|uniref:Reverse transcriptase domain-containing protein n=1 Tax=Artemisia annua TaxID=35608 RepID=A0A2U1LKZ5_ARTAN|nr:reverse transcriptase domain-containing protein [Artemisia annua]